MILEEAIKHCLEVAENNEQLADGKWIGAEGEANRQDCIQCAKDHRQLAKWLIELKELRERIDIEANNNHCLEIELEEAKRLLNIALFSIPYVKCHRHPCADCKYMDIETYKRTCAKECQQEEDACNVRFKWRYEEEALKLTRGDNNETD